MFIIGKYAFAGCGKLSCTVRLPASLTEIGYAPFTDTPITAFEVAEGNPAYSAQDGVLFDKDMKILVAYPRGKSDETYTVPDGVKRIADKAFYTNPYLSEVVFPASLEEIGNSAFYRCFALEKLLSQRTVSFPWKTSLFVTRVCLRPNFPIR